jgi:general secretion pathway protein K
MNGSRGQEGVALVTALLIVSLATVAAVSFATQQQLEIRRTGNLIDGDQAWTYAKGAEDWVRLILRRDQAKNTGMDALSEAWSQPLGPIKLSGGYLLGRISDAQARLNLNNLITTDETTVQITRDRLQKLLLLLEMDPNLVFPIVDWLDADIYAQPPYGAEDDFYTRLQPPYRTANRPMEDISELRLVKGFSGKAYQKIAPFLTALPPGTPVNVNTAPAEVLATLGSTPDLEAGVALAQLRTENPFEDPQEFLQYASEVGIIGVDGTDLDVSSQYFDANIEVRIGYGRAALRSLMWRADQGDIRVLRRTQGLN